MSKDMDNHDDLLAQASALRVDSPRDTIDRLRLDVLAEVDRLRQATIDELEHHGVLTDDGQHERLHAEYRDEVHTMDGDEYVRLMDALGPSAESVVEKIVQRNTQVVAAALKDVSPELPRMLRNAAVEATRLRLLLTLDPQVREVKMLERLGGREYKDRFDDGVPVMADYAVHWKSRVVCLVARHYAVPAWGAEDKWYAGLYASDQNGHELAPRCCVVSVCSDGSEVSDELIANAIKQLDTGAVAERITGFTID